LSAWGVAVQFVHLPAIDPAFPIISHACLVPGVSSMSTITVDLHYSFDVRIPIVDNPTFSLFAVSICLLIVPMPIVQLLMRALLQPRNEFVPPAPVPLISCIVPLSDFSV